MWCTNHARINAKWIECVFLCEARMEISCWQSFSFADFLVSHYERRSSCPDSCWCVRRCICKILSYLRARRRSAVFCLALLLAATMFPKLHHQDVDVDGDNSKDVVLQICCRVSASHAILKFNKQIFTLWQKARIDYFTFLIKSTLFHFTKFDINLRSVIIGEGII